MADPDNQEKTCPYCDEAVKAAAKKCKHCHEWLTSNPFHSRSIFMRVGLPIVVLIAGFYIVSSLACVMLTPRLTEMMMTDMPGMKLPKKFDKKINLVITEHELVETNRRLAIVGKLKNDTDIIWENVRIEAEFFDETGKFVDNGQAFFMKPIHPNEIGNFKIDFFPNSGETEKYHRYEVAVTDAMEQFTF